MPIRSPLLAVGFSEGSAIKAEVLQTLELCLLALLGLEPMPMPMPMLVGVKSSLAREAWVDQDQQTGHYRRESSQARLARRWLVSLGIFLVCLSSLYSTSHPTIDLKRVNEPLRSVMLITRMS